MASVDTLALGAVAGLQEAASSARVRARVGKVAQQIVARESQSGGPSVAELEARLLRLRRQGTLASERWLEGRMDDRSYQDYQSKLRTDVAALEEQIGQTRAASAPERSLHSKIERFWNHAAKVSTAAPARLTAQRAVLEDVIAEMVPIREGRGRFRLEITWTPVGEALRKAAGGAEFSQTQAQDLAA
jgi:hypothetical protein